MAVAALHETIRSNDEQPYGMEDVCVEGLAGKFGKIYVDARFMGAVDLETVPERSCAHDNFIVRFDYRNFERSPTEAVVVLMFARDAGRGRTFSAVVQRADWPAKRPDVVTISPCGSAFGVLRLKEGRWKATVVAPPRAADAL